MRLHANLHVALVLPFLLVGCTCDEGDGLRDAVPVVVVTAGGQSGVEALEDGTRFAVDLGLVEVGAEATRSVELRNDGRSDLNLRDLRVEGADAPAFEATAEALRLPPGESTRIALTFAPLAEGAASATMTLRTDDPASPRIEVRLAGNGYLPDVEVLPVSLDFGPVVVGTRRTLPVEVTNRSPAGVSVRVGPVQPEALAPFFEVDWSGRNVGGGRLELGPGESMRLQVTYGPTAAGRHVASFAMAPCALCRTVTVALAGSTLDSALTVEPSSLEFGAVNPGRSVSRTVRFQAVGNVPVTVDGVSLASLSSGPADPAFALVDLALPLTMAPGEAAEVTVSFSPPDLHDRVAVLDWTSDTPTNPDGLLPMHGTGGGPGIELVPRTLSFGEVAVGTTRSRRIVIDNPGYEETVVSGLAIEGGPGFSLIDAPSLPARIATGEHLTLEVSLTPREKGSVEGRLVVSSDVGHEPEAVAGLVGVARELGSCRYRVAPQALYFGTVDPGTARTLPLLVENTGTQPCLIGGFEPAPGSDPAFSVVEGTVTSLLLEPGARHEAQVRFLPTEDRQSTGAVSWYVSDPAGSEREVPLLGGAMQADLRIVPSTLDFGELGSACPLRSKRFCVLNDGPIPATLTGIEVADASHTSAFHLFDLPDALNAGGVVVQPAQRACFFVRFEPAAVRPYLDVAYVHVAGEARPLVLPLRGSVSDDAGGGVEGYGCLHGRICGPSGDRWLADADVYTLVYDAAGQREVIDTSTDEAGFFTLSYVPAGHRQFYVDKGSFSTDFYVDIFDGQTTFLDEPQCVRGESARIAVVRGIWDSIEAVLARVGATDVTLFDSPRTLLADPVTLADYDVLFVNCGADISAAMDPLLQANLRTFVEEGGSLYASDYAYSYVDQIWPGLVSFLGKGGTTGVQPARVVDPLLASHLGRTLVDLNFNLGGWVVADRVFPPVQTLVSADLATPYVDDAPLLVQFDYFRGSVIFTSFHNEAQTTADMDAILEYLVFEL